MARVTRAGYVLSAAAAVATLFIFAPRTDAIFFVEVTVPVLVVLLVIAATGALAARSGRAAVFAVAAAIALLASALQLVQFGHDPNWLGGRGSTASFLGALGVGFAGLWYLARIPQQRPDRSG